MTSSIRHGGVMRAALSLEYAEPGEPELVQLLTSGRKFPIYTSKHIYIRVFQRQRHSRSLTKICLWE